MEKKNVPGFEKFDEFAQTFYFKVKIKCCDRCPRKAEKNLKKIPGVVAVTMDTDQGVVAITGTVDPQLIMQKFGKWGKTAMLCPPPKEPVQSVHGHARFSQNNDTNNKHIKKDSDCCCSGDDSDSNDNVTMMKQRFSDMMNNPVVYPAASSGSVKTAKKSSCWSRLFGKKKKAVEPNLQRTKFRGVIPAFNPNNMNATGNMLAPRMPMPYGAPRPQYPKPYPSTVPGPNGAPRPPYPPHSQIIPMPIPHGAARMPMPMPYGAARMPMSMPYGAARTPMVPYGAPRPQYVSQFYGPMPYGRPAMPPPYPHHPAMYLPPFQPSGYFHSRPPGHYNPMIHYTRYEDNYYGY